MFNLIDRAERTGQLTELVAKAHSTNPGNARLRAFAAMMPGVAIVEERKIPAQPRATDTTTKSRQPASPIDFDWVTIPTGEFTMGSDKSKDSMARDNETPQHRLTLPEYRIARVPVTNAQYQHFVTATGHTAPQHWTNSKNPQGKEEHPVVNVTWHDAQALCEWAKVRLPSEAEWEKAARGTDGRIWPWGDDSPTERHCNFNMNIGDTTPVGNYPDGAGPYDVLDMAGNVWEWTSSLFKPYRYDANDGREDPQASGIRTLRGGSWLHTGQGVRSPAFDRWTPVPLTSEGVWRNVGACGGSAEACPQNGKQIHRRAITCPS